MTVNKSGSLIQHEHTHDYCTSHLILTSAVFLGFVYILFAWSLLAKEEEKKEEKKEESEESDDDMGFGLFD